MFRVWKISCKHWWTSHYILDFYGFNRDKWTTELRLNQIKSIKDKFENENEIRINLKKIIFMGD